MDTTTVPAPRRESTRELRALELYRRRGHEIEQIAPDIYLVPSQDGERVYRVQYGEHEFCSCPDHSYRAVNCVHILAVGIYHAKRRIRPELVAGDPFAYAGRSRAATIAAALAAGECVECGVSVAGPDEGEVALNGDVLCHGCAVPTY